jgi:molybdopterin converting factor subunit 1
MDRPRRTLSLLYFAAISDLLGSNGERLAIPDSVRNVGELGAHLERVHPALAGKLGSVRIAVNEEFAEPGAPLTDGDVVALIPPVSGG